MAPVQAATQSGFRAVHALPMRPGDQVIGALNLFAEAPGPFDPADLRIGQAADVATTAAPQRHVRRRETIAEQLQAALNSRVSIEQAKGKLAERLSIHMDRAFTMLRDHARNSNQHLTDIARDFVAGATAQFPPPPRRQPARLAASSAHDRSRFPSIAWLRCLTLKPPPVRPIGYPLPERADGGRPARGPARRPRLDGHHAGSLYTVRFACRWAGTEPAGGGLSMRIIIEKIATVTTLRIARTALTSGFRNPATCPPCLLPLPRGSGRGDPSIAGGLENAAEGVPYGEP